MDGVNAYLDFVRYCIGDSSDVPEITDWRGLFSFCRRQALLGVGFSGLERMNLSGGDVPRDLLLQWYASSERIRQRNKSVNRAAARLTEYFAEHGFRSCILKGQGNTLNYPDPYIRTCGDIDVWLEGGRSRIMSFVSERWPGMLQRYHHVEIPDYDGVAVEVHFTPSYMHSLTANRRMQKWLAGQEAAQFSHMVSLPDDAGRICVPTSEFNLVYQLSHIYRHLFSEGIGLRQLVDYYYVLLAAGKSVSDDGLPEGLKERIARTLRHLGLYRFSRALMWVLHEHLGLEERYLIAPPDGKEGRFLLNEILIGGNFGQYDHRLGKNDGESMLRRNLRMTLRNLRFVRHYPSEALSEPVFRTWYFLWRMSNG